MFNTYIIPGLALFLPLRIMEFLGSVGEKNCIGDIIKRNLFFLKYKACSLKSLKYQDRHVLSEGKLK